MNELSDAPLAVVLPILALIDGLSIGTLLIPVFLLLAPGKIRFGRIMAYLATVSVFYLIVGILFSLGLVNFVDVASDFFSSVAGQIVRLVVGAGMLIIAFCIPVSDKRKGEERILVGAAESSAGAQREHAAVDAETLLPPPADAGTRGGNASEVRPQPRLLRWREKMLNDRTGAGVVIGVALAAGLVEVASMLPYIAGMTMLASTELPFAYRVLVLAGYCLVMISPALVLIGLRAVARRAMDRPLNALSRWMQRSGAETTAWILGIVGFLIARSAATDLGLFDALSKVTQSLAG